MSINFVRGISQEQILTSVTQTKRSAVFTLANRITDFFKNKVFPFFKRFVDFVISPLRRRKISVHKAPLPKVPNTVAKKAEELLPTAPKAPLAVEPKPVQLPAVPFIPPEAAPTSPATSPVQPLIQAPAQPVQQAAQVLPPMAANIIPVIPQQPAAPPPALPAPPAPQLPTQPIVVAVQVIPFSITGEIRKLTDSILAVLEKQETMLTKFKNAWFPPGQADVATLYGLYQQVRDEGKTLAQQLSSHAQQHQDISKHVEKLKDLSGKAQLGMGELDPIVKNGVLSGGIAKLIAGSSKAQELQRGFDFIKEWRKTVQAVLNLPPHKA